MTPSTVHNVVGSLAQLYTEMVGELLAENARLKQTVEQLGRQLKVATAVASSKPLPEEPAPVQAARRARKNGGPVAPPPPVAAVPTQFAAAPPRQPVSPQVASLLLAALRWRGWRLGQSDADNLVEQEQALVDAAEALTKPQEAESIR